MNDLMLSEGKFYMVIGVVLIILLGMFIYLWTIDRKINRLEKRNEEDSNSRH